MHVLNPKPSKPSKPSKPPSVQYCERMCATGLASWACSHVTRSASCSLLCSEPFPSQLWQGGREGRDEVRQRHVPLLSAGSDGSERADNNLREAYQAVCVDEGLWPYGNIRRWPDIFSRSTEGGLRSFRFKDVHAPRMAPRHAAPCRLPGGSLTFFVYIKTGSSRYLTSTPLNTRHITTRSHHAFHSSSPATCETTPK